MTRIRFDRRLVLLVPAVIVLVVVLVASSIGGSESALEAGTEQEIGSDPGVVDRHDHFGLVGYHARGDNPVRFRAARVVGVPDGMEVLGIRAVRQKLGAGFVGAWDGDLRSGPGADLEFRPVTDVVLHPGVEEREYYLVVSVKATRPGEFHTKGIEVDWQAGKRRGTTFFPYLVGLIVPG